MFARRRKHFGTPADKATYATLHTASLATPSLREGLTPAAAGKASKHLQVERRRAWKNPLWIPGTRRAELQRDDGTVNTKGAARILGLGIHRTRQLAAAGLIPVTMDANGNYRFMSAYS